VPEGTCRHGDENGRSFKSRELDPPREDGFQIGYAAVLPKRGPEKEQIDVFKRHKRWKRGSPPGRRTPLRFWAALCQDSEGSQSRPNQNPKSEARNPKQSGHEKPENRKIQKAFGLHFGYLNLFRISDLELRICLSSLRLCGLG
jgi:hypothetical protein